MLNPIRWLAGCVLMMTLGCVPSSPAGGGDADTPQARDAEVADTGEADVGPPTDVRPPDGNDIGVVVDAGSEADGAPDPTSDTGPVPDAAPEPDAAPPCPEGEARPCPDCAGGRQTCLDGAWGECVGALEQCNGEDDDCDGAADEDFPELGEACGVGTGACRGEGVYVCGMMGARCDARPGRPGNERCDALDNDCDGETDEDFAVGDACTVGVGACAQDGNIVCHPDRLDAVCDAELIDPFVELCDGLDNDCDGIIDEGFDVGAACAAGEGLCRNEGEIVCTPDGAAACSVQAGDPAGGELCNALDDDCDGIADEQLAVGEACLIGEGDCQVPGIIACGPDLAPVCGALPDNAEACDGADNDCDGQVDEGFPLGLPCQTGGGVCQAPGTWICAADGSAACMADAPPVLGVGDGRDGALAIAAGERLVLAPGAHNFTDLTIAAGGTLAAAPYDPATGTGGLLEIRVQGRLHIEANATLDLSGLGHPGGAPNPKLDLVYEDQWTNGGGSTGYHGDGPGGGGGGFAAPQQQVGSGGGGGHALAGVAGSLCGADQRDYTVWDVNDDLPVLIAAPAAIFSSGGAAYGDPLAGTLTRGSGGGSGGNNYDGGAASVGGAGGPGGGALLIVAAEVVVDGTIRNDGAGGAAGVGGSYVGGGGGGAGGGIYIAAPTVSISAAGTLSAIGGAGAAGTRGAGGQGSVGWIRIDAGALRNDGQAQPAPSFGAFDCALPE